MAAIPIFQQHPGGRAIAMEYLDRQADHIVPARRHVRKIQSLNDQNAGARELPMNDAAVLLVSPAALKITKTKDPGLRGAAPLPHVFLFFMGRLLKSLSLPSADHDLTDPVQEAARIAILSPRKREDTRHGGHALPFRLNSSLRMFFVRSPKSLSAKTRPAARLEISDRVG